MNIDRRKFLLKALIVGALGTSIGTYDYNMLEGKSISVPLWFTIVVLISHFRIILLFWLAFENQIKAKKWLFAGFVGSLVYATLFWIFGEFISFETAKLLIILKQLIIGALSAVPVWVVLKVNYSKAHLWIIANAIGYALLEVYITNINFISSIGIISKVVHYSFLTLQFTLDGFWVIGYALFGLLLGVFVYKIIEDGVIESKSQI